MTDPLSLIPQENFIRHGGGKFAAKLSDEDRCSVLALVKSGVRRDRIAAAFGLDRRTVGHLANAHSLKYKDVREKYTAMGHEEFIKRYLTEEVALKMAALPPEEEKVPEVKSSSPRANRMAGMHKVKPPQCEYEHRIEIKYITVNEQTGWHFRDLDSKLNPDRWFHNGIESMRTSHACYDAAVENLLDD